MKKKKDRFTKKMADPAQLAAKYVNTYGVITHVGKGTKYVMVKIKDGVLYQAKIKGNFYPKPSEKERVKVVGEEFGLMLVQPIRGSGSQIPQ